MSVKLITQLNPFSAERKTEYCEACSIAEILKKIDINKAVNTGWRVLINDQIITDFSTVTKDGDTVYIRLVPEGDQQTVGEAGKFAGLSLMALGAVAFAIPVVGTFLGTALLGSGVAMFLNGVVVYNFAPTSKNRNKQERSPSIRGSRNQTRLMSPVPILLGKHRIYADAAANSYTMVEDGEQYLYQLLSCGQKDQIIDISTLKIGDTNIAEYSASGDINAVLDGSDNLINLQINYGSQPSWFNKCVHEDMINEEIRHKLKDSEALFTLTRTTPAGTEEINVDVFFLNGLGKYNNGDLESAKVQIEAYYKKESEDDSHYQLLGYFNGTSNTISNNQLKTLRYSVSKTGLQPDSYTVKIVRVTDDSDGNSNITDTVYCGSIRAIKHTPSVSAIRCGQLTTLSLKIKASEKLNNFVDQLNFVSQSKLPVYSGISSGKAEWNTINTSSNPASAAIYAMQGELSQQKLSDSEIDWPAFEALYNWCNTHDYECNAYITESSSISEVLQQIASTCRAEIYRQNGKMTVIQDIARDGFVQIFTPRNSWGYEEQIGFAEIPDALSLQITDSNAGYADQEILIYNTPDGNKEAEPELVQDVPLWGVTDSVQARKLGMYKYAVSKFRPVVHKFSADFEYMLCTKGDWIKYAGDVALAGITQGRIAELITDGNQILGFKSDEEIPMEPGKDYAVRIRQSNGSADIYRVYNSGATSKDVYFLNSVSSDIADGDLFLFGEPDMDSIDLIVTDIQCDDDLTATLVCVEYAPEIYGVDNPDYILPDFTNLISDVPSVVDNGAVISEWQTYTTYNDNTTEPETPVGNGTTNGWHLNQTIHSKWQSTKTARNIYTGTWGAPVNIESQAVRSLSSLLEYGTTGEVAIYNSYFYQYDGTTWNPVSRDNYLGILNEVPANGAIGQFFLAGPGAEGKSVESLLKTSKGLLQVKKTDPVYLSLKLTLHKDVIYVCDSDGWHAITNKNDYHYIIALNDSLGSTGELPPLLSNKIDSQAEDQVNELAPTIAENKINSLVPDMASNIAEDTVPNYLGICAEIPDADSHHLKDYFLYVPLTTPAEGYQKGKLYRLEKSGDKKIWKDIADNPGSNYTYYMTALNDLFDPKNGYDTSTGAFTSLFARNLVALEAFIKALEAERISFREFVASALRETPNVGDQYISMGKDPTKQTDDNFQFMLQKYTKSGWEKKFWTDFNGDNVDIYLSGNLHTYGSVIDHTKFDWNKTILNNRSTLESGYDCAATLGDNVYLYYSVVVDAVDTLFYRKIKLNVAALVKTSEIEEEQLLSTPFRIKQLKQAITFNGRIILLSLKEVAYSNDGISFRLANLGAVNDDLRFISIINNGLYVFGQKGECWYSADGVIYSNFNLGIDRNAYPVKIFDGESIKSLGVSALGAIYISASYPRRLYEIYADGITVEAREIGLPDRGNKEIFDAVVYGGYMIVLLSDNNQLWLYYYDRSNSGTYSFVKKKFIKDGSFVFNKFFTTKDSLHLYIRGEAGIYTSSNGWDWTWQAIDVEDNAEGVTLNDFCYIQDKLFVMGISKIGDGNSPCLYETSSSSWQKKSIPLSILNYRSTVDHGYIEFSNGLLIQWGQRYRGHVLHGQGYESIVNLPVSYKRFFRVFGSSYTVDTLQGGSELMFKVSDSNLSSFMYSFYNRNVAISIEQQGVMWMTIGY